VKAEEKPVEVCEWVWSPHGYWEGTCQVTWEFLKGGLPYDNGLYWCPRCGGRLEVAPTRERGIKIMSPDIRINPGDMPVVTKEGQIIVELRRLGEEVIILSETVATLKDKLGPILAPVPPDTSIESSEAPQNDDDSILAAELHDLSMSIGKLTNSLQVMTRRVQL